MEDSHGDSGGIFVISKANNELLALTIGFDFEDRIFIVDGVALVVKADIVFMGGCIFFINLV